MKPDKELRGELEVLGEKRMKKMQEMEGGGSGPWRLRGVQSLEKGRILGWWVVWNGELFIWSIHSLSC